VRQAIIAYLHRQAEKPAHAGRVLHAEQAFGMPTTAETPDSANEPLILGAATGTIRVRGKIDRIDVLTTDTAEQKCFVVDYKTGGVPRLTDDIQLPVYIRAAEQMTGLSGAGGAFHGVRPRGAKDAYLVEFKMPRGPKDPAEAYAKALDTGIASVHEAVAGIAAGRFDAVGAHECPGRCPYRRICGYSEARADLKTPREEEAANE
jgi:RecB family exonuclease